MAGLNINLLPLANWGNVAQETIICSMLFVVHSLFGRRNSLDRGDDANPSFRGDVGRHMRRAEGLSTGRRWLGREGTKAIA